MLHAIASQCFSGSRPAGERTGESASRAEPAPDLIWGALPHRAVLCPVGVQVAPVRCAYSRIKHEAS